MNDTQKPNFASWELSVLAKLTHDIWDDNIKLRDANEQLRLDLKDAMKLLRTTVLSSSRDLQEVPLPELRVDYLGQAVNSLAVG